MRLATFEVLSESELKQIHEATPRRSREEIRKLIATEDVAEDLRALGFDV